MVPILDELIVVGLYGASYPVDWALGRMFVVHFCVGLISLLGILMHLIFVHRAKPGNISVAGDLSQGLGDVLQKDFQLLGLFQIV